MKYEQLENLAKEGKLFIAKHLLGTFTKRKFIYKNNFPKLDKDWKDNVDYFSIDRVEKVKYQRYTYLAYTTDMSVGSFYKITKKNYENLLSAGAVEK